MKHLMNSNIEQKLSDFYEEQKRYKDEDRPDLDRIRASSVDMSIQRIVRQLEKHSKAKLDFVATEDVSVNGVYLYPRVSKSLDKTEKKTESAKGETSESSE